jgi:hypothetical protein
LLAGKETAQGKVVKGIKARFKRKDLTDPKVDGGKQSTV